MKPTKKVMKRKDDSDEDELVEASFSCICQRRIIRERKEEMR